jgi:peptide/nickel transport system permease protein
MRSFGFALLAVIFVAALGAAWLAPYASDVQARGFLNAPPTPPHVQDDTGAWHAPFIYPWKLTSQLEQRYEQNRSQRVRLSWFSAGRLVVSSDDARMPFFLLGADSYGRDVFSRLLYGARISLGLSLAAAAGALIVGAFVGGIAG